MDAHLPHLWLASATIYVVYIVDDEILLQQPLTPKPEAVLNHFSFTFPSLLSYLLTCHVLAVPSVLSAFLLFSLYSPGSPA